ncbi:DUF7446 family protein [Pasteurella sp. PK-2025]|uniref:DUF7446 family protein n=1 Tax=unclassified Pasteurella TaxID=2621516 RepID=UPI003C7098CB
MKKLTIGVSPLTNEIYVGTLDKSGKIWKEKQEMTVDVLTAVVEHGLKAKQPMILSAEDGTPHFKITVEDLRK